MPTKTALVAGASGFVGRRIADHLLSRGDWAVIGIARRPPAKSDMQWIALDLADERACGARSSELRNVTHVFYAARFDHPEEGRTEPVATNGAMLANLVGVVESVAPLQHVHAVHGSKYYGHQLGPVPVPMRENTPRACNDNYYFVQEDFLVERSRSAKWTYSTSRPHSFCDPAVDHPRSIGLVLAVYGAIQRELGLPFDFPGGEKAYEARTQFTEVAFLARAVTWMATEPRCANQSFNVVNGDYPRWRELWPHLATGLGLNPGTPRRFSFAKYMADKGRVWDRIVARHGLRKTALHELVLWPYGDYQMRPEWDIVSSMSKARERKFNDTVDSHAMFLRHFETYRAEKIIP